MTVDKFFEGQPEARRIHEAVEKAVLQLGPSKIAPSKSQISFRRRRPFAATWRPGQYLKGCGAPLVLTIYLQRRDASPRWKEVAEAAPGRFTHHLELRSTQDVDDEVRQRLAEAWELAG